MDDDYEGTRDLVVPAVFMRKIGQSVELSQGKAVVYIDGRPEEVEGHAEISFHWDGTGLVGQFQGTVPIGSIELGEDFESATIRITEPNLSTTKVGVDVERRTDVALLQPTLFGEQESFEFRFRFKLSPIDMMSDDRSLKMVTAHLLNAPRYLGMAISSVRPFGKGRFMRRDRLELVSDGWRITIDNLACWIAEELGLWNEDEANISLAALRVLGDAETIGGTFITHAIRIERTKRSIFNRKQAISAINRLETFLTFAFGRPSETLFMHGFNATGEVAWKALPSKPIQAPTGGRGRGRSWMPLVSDRIEGSRADRGIELNDKLSSMFATWMKLSEDEESGFKKMLSRSVEWYSASLEASSRNQCIVLAQASLEVLSNYCLRSKLHLSEDSQQKLSFADQLTITLSVLGISIELPSSFATPRSRASTGPVTVTRARNSVVHPRAGREEVSSEEVEHARALSLWYIEMIIFYLLGYTGPYWNRIEGKVEFTTRKSAS